MFYQNNNDYMRDAFFYSTPQNTTYQNGCVNGFTPMNNMQAPIGQNSAIPINTMGNTMIPHQNTNHMMTNQGINPIMNQQMPNNIMSQQCMQSNDISAMYPQIYRIINPVANRVISNSNCQCITEDALNNMVDIVYNIVEGDVSTLSNSIPTSGDDTVTQGTSTRGTTSNTNTNTTSNTGTRQTTMNTESSRSTRTTVSSHSGRESNYLLRDLIKIIIIKELLSRHRGFWMENSFTNQMNNSRFVNNPNNFYDSRMYGII